MPHITVEYSANVAEHHDIQALIDQVHEAALADGLPDITALRTRGAERANYRIADGDTDHAFIAITARIGPGRDSSAKTSFLEAILAAAEAQAATEPSPLAIAWSAEVTEIQAEFRINHNHVRTRLAEQKG